MTFEKSGDNSIVESLRKNWAIIFFVGSIVVGWSNIVSRLENLENSVIILKADYTKQAETTTKLSDAIIEIKANFEFIKEKLNNK